MNKTTENKYWIGFSKIPGVGRVKIALLLNMFGSLENAWNASMDELINSGLDSKTADSVVRHRNKISLDRELELIEKYHIKVINCESPEYPKLLKEVYDHPPVIFIRGDIKDQDESILAVVGTRRATSYGRQVTEELVTDLAHNGITIVSGLAKGIDAIAHRAALDANGRTIAIFASGLDIVYPPENVKLAREIMEHGALISEHPLGTKPKADNFPRRNRILSGLSRGVLIVESGESGGALITANFAVEQNREVFAVPGNIFSLMSKGPNKLIQEGAKLVRNYMDIIEELNISVAVQQLEMKEVTVSDRTESLIINCVSAEPVHIDQICRNSGLDTAIVTSTVAILELKGLVQHVGNLNYVIAKNLR